MMSDLQPFRCIHCGLSFQGTLTPAGSSVCLSCARNVVGSEAWVLKQRLGYSVSGFKRDATPAPAPGATTSTLPLDTSVQSVHPSAGVKHDSGKLQFRLIDPAFYRDMVGVLTLGARKYAPMNWIKVAPERYEDALERHWNAWRTGEKDDPESKLSHLVHVAVNAMFLWAHERKSAAKL